MRRGIWHRLMMRDPGRLLFINIRTSMQSRRPRAETDTVMAIDFDQIDIVAHDMDATLAFYRRARRPDP